MAKLSPAQVKQALTETPEWKKKGAAISRTFEFEGFADAIQFVDRVAEIAEAADHHPDIDIRWNKVTLTLTTHDSGGLTQSDFDVAKKIDAV